MIRRSRQTPAADIEPPFGISLEKVCTIIAKISEFEVKDAVTEPDPGSNPSDDNMIEVLEDHPDDASAQEVIAFISALSEDEQIDLVALAWLGRDEMSSPADWASQRAEAERAHRPAPDHTARYLLGMPLVSEFLADGLSMFGRSCVDVEVPRRRPEET